eukprot:GHVH01003859.1.p1 GENE.GHVH01003859.1~~GHVH01003859.1.p1  ORF type:complete len:363 (+),score=37.16 GHVH01003859.1:395-1483(+)
MFVRLIGKLRPCGVVIWRRRLEIMTELLSFNELTNMEKRSYSKNKFTKDSNKYSIPYPGEFVHALDDVHEDPIDACDHGGCTPLMAAVCSGNYAMTQLIVRESPRLVYTFSPNKKILSVVEGRQKSMESIRPEDNAIARTVVTYSTLERAHFWMRNQTDRELQCLEHDAKYRTRPDYQRIYELLKDYHAVLKQKSCDQKSEGGFQPSSAPLAVGQNTTLSSSSSTSSIKKKSIVSKHMSSSSSSTSSIKKKSIVSKHMSSSSSSTSSQNTRRASSVSKSKRSTKSRAKDQLKQLFNKNSSSSSKSSSSSFKVYPSLADRHSDNASKTIFKSRKDGSDSSTQAGIMNSSSTLVPDATILIPTA